MGEAIDVAVVGAGHAGLAASWHLAARGVAHVVLEAGRIVLGVDRDGAATADAVAAYL